MLLVAKDQLRYATMEESAAASVIANDAKHTADQAEDKKAYADVTIFLFPTFSHRAESLVTGRCRQKGGKVPVSPLPPSWCALHTA